MKLVKGQTLSKLLADRGDAADERGRFIGIFEQVCQTMAYAHSRGVIHRDLKPANIMVGAFGEVQVMDWGLAKVLQVGGVADEKKYQLQQGQSIIQTMRSGVGSDSPGTFGSVGSETQMGSVMGTPAYMPPEQALGEVDQMDERADVFGLGAILCEILTGKPPYVAEDGTRVFRMASRGKLDDAFSRLETCGADEDLIALTKHCLELDPKARPRDAGVLAERVTGYLESVESKLRETEVKRAAEAARAIEARKRMRVTMALAASVLLMLSLGGGGWVWIQQQAADRREVATANVNSALSDAQVHQSLADSAELDMQVTKLDKAVSSAQQAVELAEQNEVEVSLSNRAKTMLAALQTRATNVRELTQQARRDREFQEALELIRLSQADGGAQEITIEDSQDGRGGPKGEGSDESDEAQMVGGPAKKVIFQLFDISSAAKRYEEVFREAGLDLSTLDVSQAAAMIRSSAIRESQIAAIDNWARAIPRPGPPSETASTEPAAAETNLPEGSDASNATDESTTNMVNTNDADTVALRQRLLAIANAADDSEWRRTVRAALEANDTTKLKELAATDEARSQSPELIAWLGAALRDGEEAEASVAVLLQAQRNHPGDFWLNYELSKSFSKQGDHLEGLGFARASLGIRPNSLGALMSLAASSSSAKRYDDAAAIYRAVVKENPKLVEAHTELASVATSLEQWDEAIAAYRAVLALEPKNVEVRAFMGIAHYSAQHYDEAIETCRKAVELDPQSAYAYLCLGQVLTGIKLGGVSQNKAAEQAFDRAIELDPTNARAYYYRGWLKFEVDDKRALADQRTAIRLDPNLGAAYAYLARFGDDEPDKRITYARKAVELDPSDAYAHAALSAALWKTGQLDESLSAGQAAISCDPKSGEIHTIVGRTLEQLNRPDEALVEFRTAVKYHPNHYWCNITLGTFLVNRNEHLDEAVSCLTRVYYPDRQRHKWTTGAIHHNLRRVVALHAQQGELDRAAPVFRNILEREGNSTIAWNFLQSLVREFWSTEGLETYRKIAELAPESVTAQTHLSRELQKQGLLDEAFVACRTAIELAPTSSEPYEQLASLFKAQGGVDDVAAYSKVLESYPNVATALLNSFARRLVTTPDADGKYRHLDEAVQWAQSACDLEPERGAIWNTLAVAQYRRGQWQAAIDAIEKSQQLGYAEAPSNRLFLTMAHWQLGNQEQAAKAYTKAILVRQQTETDQELQSFFAEASNLLGRTGLEQILAFTPNNSEVAAELANLVLDSNPVDWTILEPTEMKSERGATLTLLDDGSILAGGENSPGESYQLVMQSDLKSITAYRLEVLTDPSLPGQGPGRGHSGNFGVTWSFQAANPTGSGEASPIRIRSAIADYSYARYPITDSRWNIAGGQGLPHTAFLALDAPLQNEAGNSFTLTIKGPTSEKYGDENLGRFRLSVTDAPFAFENASVRIAAMKLTDPWTKLAAAYDIVGDQQALARVLEQHPETASLELAQFLAERGKISLASQHVNEALPSLVKARELFASISAKHPESKWTVLEPTKMTSAGGAALTKLDDHSILASGTNPDKEVYEFETQLQGSDFTAIRLEGLTHPSLEKGSHGRSIGNGNVVLTEFEAEVASAETPEDWRPIKFNNGWTDHPEASRDIENAIDGNLQNGWTTDHKDVPLDRTAIFTADTPFGHKSGTRLRIRLRHESEWGHHAFGRIRLSVTSDPHAIEAAPFHQQLQESDLAGLERALGNAYSQLGKVDDAVTAFQQALDLADDHDARTKVVQAAVAYDGVLDKLTKLRPKDAALHDALARHYQARGELVTARSAAAKARALYEQQLAAEPMNSLLAQSLADLLLLDAEMATAWTILEPTEMTSAGGATLTLQDDGSILASGTNAPRDQYNLEFVVPADIDLRSLRLEALADPSLPENGPGRAVKGSFVLNPWQLTATPKEGGDARMLKFVAAVADYEFRDYPIRPDGWWSIDGRKSTSRVAIWQSADSQNLTQGTTLNLRLDFDRNERVTNLGRFRLSISDNSLACDLLTSRKLTDPWAKLAVVYHVVGDQQQLDKLLAAHPEAKSSIDSLNGLSWLRDLRASGLAIKKGKQLPDDTWELDLEGATFTDLAILKGPPISRLSLKKTAVSDLSPLRGLPLKHLNLEGTRVTDLTLLQEMPLVELVLAGLPISDLKALSGLPISRLWLGNTAVTDLESLRGMPLTTLQIYNTGVIDLSPLHGMPLEHLHISGTKVTDLAPLRGMPLTGLRLHACTELTDVSPLADCKELQQVTLPPKANDIEFLRTLPKLERLSFKEDNRPGVYAPDKTAEEFWKDYDAKKQ